MTPAKRPRSSFLSAGVVASMLVLAVGGPASRAENVDPDGAEAQYAWGENLGWFNAQPFGRGGPGLQVEDFELTGWLWGENTGWISASCKNTDSCDRIEYGVWNDGQGNLSGFAWAENLGWVNFRPATGGVQIDPETGLWDGTAWTENGGWINFGFAVSDTNRIRTGWTCSPTTPPPGGVPLLTVAKTLPAPDGTDAGHVVLSWSPAAGGSGTDVIRGDLMRLRATDGDFGDATDACLRGHSTMTELIDTDAVALDASAWYLVRDVNCATAGTYDTAGAGLAAPRDAGIALSGNDCP